eukprot:TRINITY_DN1754_c0_g1_i2.p1 TRINITY_DN1754_c0_g1~~TRINITY_DN1754_c0_g1_i2.p1  ORF type:complete len:210 (+),score=16.41 TRINITY_DN1754_c0_g1_i2:224-853(+)
MARRQLTFDTSSGPVSSPALAPSAQTGSPLISPDFTMMFSLGGGQALIYAFVVSIAVLFTICSALRSMYIRYVEQDGQAAMTNPVELSAERNPALSRDGGLSQATIATFSTFKYEEKGDAGPVEEGHSTVTCVVCLEDYSFGDLLRQLPECRHYFHVDCIDEWFTRHKTCPVCRQSLQAEKTDAGNGEGEEHQEPEQHEEILRMSRSYP